MFEKTVIARLDKGTDSETLWDLERPLEKSARLELLPFDDPEGKKVFWHSSAHILGEASERRFGCDLCIGPPIEDGFYYEMALPEKAAVESTDWKPLENIVSGIVKEKQVFQRLSLSKDDLLEMFKANPYKQHIIKDKIPDGTFTTVYRNGPLIDLCRGPHVPHTGRIKQFKIMKNSASYFLGDANNDSLQRIYGVSFPDKDSMQAHLKYLEEAAKRDHRKIGLQQELFFFHEYSPGSPFLLPHGMAIHNAMMAFLKEEYCKYLVPYSIAICLRAHANTRVGIRETWLSGGRITKHVQLYAVEDEWSLATLLRRHVHLRCRKGKMGAEAHELSWSLSHLWTP